MNPALETLLLAFSGSDPLPVPDRALFIGAEPHPDFATWPGLTGWQPIKHRAEGWDKVGLTRVDDLPEGRWPVVLVLPGKSRDEVLASRKDPETAERWLKAARNVRSKVKTALEDQNKDGVWTDDNEIEAGLFVKHLNAMSTYVNASAKAKLNP